MKHPLTGEEAQYPVLLTLSYICIGISIVCCGYIVVTVF